MVYLPLIEFLQEDKRIYYVVVKTFCDSILPQICEPPESTTSDAEGGVSLGFSTKLSLLTGVV